MSPKLIDGNVIDRATPPAVPQHPHETQKFGQIVKRPIALSEATCRQSVEALNQLLADTITLRDLYKKHHWQVAGPRFYPLHQLFDKHAAEQSVLVDTIAERIQMLGGVSLAMAHDIAEATRIPRPPKGHENAGAQLVRLLTAHELLIEEARPMAQRAAESGDAGTNDLIATDIIRGNEMQSWFIGEHLVPAHCVPGAGE